MDRLKTKRIEARLTQEAIAKKAGISCRAYQNYESGGPVPNVYAALKIADALHSTAEELFSPHD